MRSTSILLLIFMSDIFFLYMSNEGCITFIIHRFLWFMGKIYPYLQKQAKKTIICTAIQLNTKTVIFNLQLLHKFCIDFYATNTNISAI